MMDDRKLEKFLLSSLEWLSLSTLTISIYAFIIKDLMLFSFFLFMAISYIALLWLHKKSKEQPK